MGGFHHDGLPDCMFTTDKHKVCPTYKIYLHFVRSAIEVKHIKSASVKFIYRCSDGISTHTNNIFYRRLTEIEQPTNMLDYPCIYGIENLNIPLGILKILATAMHA